MKNKEVAEFLNKGKEVLALYNEAKEVLVILNKAKEELEESNAYKKVQELEALYVSLSNERYKKEIEYKKAYYISEGYECRDISNCEMEFSDDYIGYESVYNFIILPSSLPEVHKLIITNLCTQDFIVFKDGSKYLLGDVVIGNSDTEEDAWDDIYVSTIDREYITKNIHRYS